MIRTVEEAGQWLAGLIDLERRRDWDAARLSLEPIRRLLARLGDPQDGLEVIHVAGSKGKGSTALLAEALLGAAGERVGTFTSPHLERWTERVRVGGAEVGGAALAAAVAEVRPHVEAQVREEPDHAPTFFDATTAAALVCFRTAGLRRAVLEVGLGGRLDSTNAVRSAVACITSIELEHTDKLGDTLAAIAAEKAGILEPGGLAVVGELAPEARAVVARRAEALGVRVAWAGREFAAERLALGPEGQRLRLRDGSLVFEVELPVWGRHQVANAALAFACVRRASAARDEELADAARTGWSGLRLPGRIEVLARDPLVVVDSAHTAASAAALAGALREMGAPPLHLVLSVSAGKDLPRILAELLPLASAVTATRADARRSLTPREVAAAVREARAELPLRVVPNPQLALRAAREAAGAAGGVCVAGSVYLAGIARRVLAPSASRAPVALTRGGGPVARG